MITEINGKIHLSCEFNDLAQIFRMKFIEEKEVNIVFPLKETVIFDLQEGRVSLEVQNGDGELLGRENVTERIDIWRGKPTYSLIMNHKYMLQSIAEKFQAQWPVEKLPFELEELTPERLVLMTKYVGFSRKFYFSLPLTRDRDCVDESFQGIDQRLRKVEDVCDILREHKIPSIKALNRILYSNPGMCYYAEELMAMWKVINNLDFFVRLLQTKQVYEVLSFLHDFPNAIAFFQDYIRVKSVAGLIRRINNEWQDIRIYAVAYSAMSESRKAREHQRWNKKPLFLYLSANYSRPVQTEEIEVTDCFIEEYAIVRLRTVNDFMKASDELQNCLWNWENYLHSAVFVIKKGNKCRAAVQVREGKVLMALGYDNRALEYDEEANQIYKKWLTKWGLKEEKIQYDPLDDDDLPF